MKRHPPAAEFILSHCALYPLLEPGDLLKALHQSAFGCGHLVSDDAARRLEEELSALRPSQGPDLERLYGGYCRFHLRGLEKSGLSPATLLRVFALSSRMPCRGRELLEEMLDEALGLARLGKLPFPAGELERETQAWRAAGCPARRHSEGFRARYAPAYRVIHAELARFIELFSAIDGLKRRRDRVIVAIEGGSASGKTTLARVLGEIYDCNILHMDDFFLRPGQRTPERLAQPGGNIDHERFYSEVLSPLARGERAAYRRYDCGTRTLLPPADVFPKPLSIVEGAYSLHPALSDAYDLSVFLKISPEKQRARIEKREPRQLQSRFFEEWIPLERRYFDAAAVEERCDLVFDA